MRFGAHKKSLLFAPNPMGKRDADRPESGETVDHSVPGLKGPTLSVRTGIRPDACPVVSQGAHLPPVLQPKSERGVGQSPTALAFDCVSDLDRDSLDRLIAFFRLLDQWERKLHAKTLM
jgi:hypothetical protein